MMMNETRSVSVDVQRESLRDCSGQQSRDAPAINTAHLTKDDKTQTTKFTDHITVYRPQSSSNSLQATVNPCEELARRMLIVLLSTPST